MLYFVSTPIGNIKDMTYRAVEVLNSVDYIGCEDTRHSIPLLNHYQIKKPLFSYQKFNEAKAGEKIIEMLKEGKSIAIISDAGTPVISDPGSVLVKMLIENGLEFTVVPGANAVLPALILSGLDSARFTFIGFLPEKKSDRQALLNKLVMLDTSLIFYVAPHDLEKTSNYLSEVFGPRRAVAVKEITKMFETRCEFILGEQPNVDTRGEFVLVVEGQTQTEDYSSLPLKEHIALYINEGLSKMDAIKKVAKERGVQKSVIYKQVIDEE
ncbi:MAG: 16S rRNA (cytidine(1402)-2'-O)-methyltransferase [Clostridia bacterium]|nr:16S rRNA (cytidine(1402)-2'-O)-methyltransferase [Clostridia bacterium]MBQ3496190.1 16S rRNA (cytidine(1402)-2'-O)-methyltransferase [Clostridia bacterium]MBQ4586386.1 16S rRNA (cytidine(1402)-2'-O)-methyltransferase [Clostridia bacterium]MBQ6883999.1 16S rRNA (cytidine(1402)-2'-O)-methyltransferase [Clostridia bacterium]